MVRKYGAPDPGGGFTLAGTKGAIDRPNIYLQGGIWGPDDPLEVSVENVTMTFVRTNADSGTITFTAGDGTANPFYDQPTIYPGDQFILVYGAEGAANNYKGFQITAKSGNTLTVKPGPLLSPGTTGNSETVTGMSAVATVPGGHVFSFFSTGAVVRDVSIVQPRGIQFFVSGSNFLLSHCKSRQKALDGGGGVILKRGRFIRCEQLDLECSDDVFIFSPDEGSALDPVVLEDCCVVDSVCSSSSGIVAFLTSGDAIQTEPDFGLMRNCYARNILGRYSDNRLRYGRHGIKFHNANGAFPMENCWVDGFVLDQTNSTVLDGVAVRAVVGRGSHASNPPYPGSGIVNCGIRNGVILNRAGPALFLERLVGGLPADVGESRLIDFTVENVRCEGAGLVPGTPLIQSEGLARLTIRNLTGDLAEGAAGVDPGRALVVADVAQEQLGSLVIDGFEATNAALPAGGPAAKGLWRIGNVAQASVRRLSARKKVGTTVDLGGVEMVTTGGSYTGLNQALFEACDFREVAYPLINWRNNPGNAVAHSTGFDDELVKYEFISGGTNRTLTPNSYARVIRVTLNTGVPTDTVTVKTLAAPPSGSPQRTLLLGPNVSAATGGNLLMGAKLTGGAAADSSVTFQWQPVAAKWVETARYAAP